MNSYGLILCIFLQILKINGEFQTEDLYNTSHAPHKDSNQTKASNFDSCISRGKKFTITNYSAGTCIVATFDGSIQLSSGCAGDAYLFQGIKSKGVNNKHGEGPSNSSERNPEAGPYLFKNVLSGLCLTGTVEGPVIQQSCDWTAGQKLYTDKHDESFWTGKIWYWMTNGLGDVNNTNNGKCLSVLTTEDVHTNSTSNKPWIEKCNESNYYQWWIPDSGNC